MDVQRRHLEAAQTELFEINQKASESYDARLHTEDLKLAVTLNRVDIAKTEFFNGDTKWTVRNNTTLDITDHSRHRLCRQTVATFI